MRFDRLSGTVRSLFQAGGLSVLTAVVTLLVVTVSATGTDPSVFRTYNLGYFIGTFFGMVLHPQFSFFVLQFGVSERERLQMLLASGLIVSMSLSAGVILWIAEFDGLLGLGLFSGLVLNSSLYLNTEMFSSALRRQTLNGYFRIRILAVIVPFAVWGTVIGVSNSYIAGLLAFELVRGLVFFLSFAVAVSILTSNVGRAGPLVRAPVIKAMVSRHVIKVFEAVLVVLFPFFIMSQLDADIAPIRIGFQIGMTLTGVVGIVIVPRVLRTEHFKDSASIFVHVTTLFVTMLAGLLTYLWWHTNTPSLIPYLAGAVLAIFLPLLSLNGVLALRLRGANVVAIVWVMAVGMALSLHFGIVKNMVPFLAGLWFVNVGYSLSMILSKRTPS